MQDKSNRTRVYFLTLLCFSYYFIMMLARYGLSAAIPGLMAAEGYTKAELGRVASAYFLAYALMKLPCGVLGDRVSASLMMVIGAAGAAFSNLLFATSRSLAAMTVFWMANGFFQAFVWSSMMRVCAVCIDDSFRTTAVLILNASTPFGTIATYALSARLSGHRWQLYFILSGCALLAMVAIWLVFQRKFALDAPADAPSQGAVLLPFSRMKKEYLRCGLPLILAVSVLHGMLKDGFSTWVPTYLTEVFSMTSRSALTLSMVLPLVNLCGIFLVGQYTRRSSGNELTGITGGFLFSVIVSALMAFVFQKSLPGTVVCFALVTASMQAINAFITSLVPMQFRSSGLVSTTAGVLDSCIYLGSSCTGILFGGTAEAFGWNGTRLLWLAISVLGFLIAALAIKKWSAFKRSVTNDSLKDDAK